MASYACLPKTAHQLLPLGRIITTRQPASRCAGTNRHRRRFHISALGDAVAWTADGISSLHVAGLPWYLAIPVAATAVNFSIRLPIQHYTRRLVVKRAALTPLIAAWTARHSASVSHGPREIGERLWRVRVASLTEKSRGRIYKAWGVQRWKSLATLLSMIPFVFVSEALRRLCGAPVGLIGHNLGFSNIDTVSSVQSLSSCDPSLATGGYIWFADLTAMDPYYVLPAISSLLLAKTSWGRLSKQQLRSLLTLDRREDVRTLASQINLAVGRMLLLTPVIPLLFADLPSAIFLYWAATFGLSDINESILGKLVPKPRVNLVAIPKPPSPPPYLLGRY